MSDPRHWSCSGCGLRTSSSTHVRARYCGKCGTWCDRTDDGDGMSMALVVYTSGEAEAVKLAEQLIRHSGARPVVQA